MFDLGIGMILTFSLCQFAEEKEYDLTNAVIVASVPGHAKAVDMLKDEVEKRTGIRLTITESMPDSSVPAIVLGTVESLADSVSPPTGLEIPSRAEGYAIWIDGGGKAPIVYLAGYDQRGTMFAAGRLIRLLHMGQGEISVSDDVRLSTSPQYPVRVHMMIPGGEFIKWDLEAYEQYIRDMIIFGTNGFMLTNFREDVAELIDSYGLDLWVFFGHGKVVDMKTIDDVRKTFGHLKGLDHVFIPLGDTSGVKETRAMIPATEHFAPLLKQVHPDARIWLSHQNQANHAENENEYLFGYLLINQPDWLEGMVYGPWSHNDIPGLRQWTPEQYSIVQYPDICHNRRCQYLIPGWDRAFARTWSRNGIRVMPRMEARIHNVTAPITEGFFAYNHTGCNNDLSKFVWSAMSWDTRTDINEMLREYGKVFFGDKHAAEVAEGLIMLEDNWVGPTAENSKIEKALEHWQNIARDIGNSDNWRLQLFLYKAFIDAYVKRKHTVEMQYQADAYKALKQVKADGVQAGIDAARAALARVDTEFTSKEDLEKELQDWGLNKYQELEEILDNLYCALNDRQWLEAEFKTILAMEDKASQLARIHRILNWEDPGPAGFYDNLGVQGQQPHLVRQREWRYDPGYVHSPIEFNTYKPRSAYRQSWLVTILTRYDTPLRMRYDGLDPEAKYRLRAVYSGPFESVTRLVANGKYEIHPPLPQPEPMRPLEFDIPPEATKDGVLELEWQLTNPRRGCNVGEVWLIKQQD